MTMIGTAVEFINMTLPAYTLYCVIWATIIISNKWRLKYALSGKWNAIQNRA